MVELGFDNNITNLHTNTHNQQIFVRREDIKQSKCFIQNNVVRFLKMKQNDYGWFLYPLSFSCPSPEKFTCPFNDGQFVRQARLCHAIVRLALFETSLII